MTQLNADCWWLEKHDVMDYSFLLLIYNKNDEQSGNFGIPSLSSASSYEDILPRKKGVGRVSFFRLDHGGWWASNEKNENLDNCLYFFSVIDILQPFNWRKKIENGYKALFENEDAISCVNPAKYRKRFVTSMQYYLDKK